MSKTKMSRKEILANMNVARAVLKISTPSAISSLASVIYNIIDTIFIGRYVGIIGIAAISIYLPIQMIILSVSLLFAAGIGSFISRELGKKNYEASEKSIGTLIAFVGTSAIILLVVGFGFTRDIVELFGAKTNVIADATTYAKMMFIGVIFYPFCIASNNVMRAQGDTHHSMRGTMLSIVANIFLDILFIVILKWGVLGAGLATTISKFINFLYVLYYFKFKSFLKIKMQYIKYNFKLLRKAIPIGFSTFVNQFAGSIAIMLLNRDLFALGGNYVIAVYGVVYKLTSFVQISVAGFSRGCQPIIGFNYGAKNSERVRQAVKWGMIYTTVFTIFATIIMIIFSKDLIYMFSNKVSMIDYAAKILIIALLATPFLGVYFMTISYYRAIGKAKESLILSLFRRVFFFMPFLYLLPYTFHLGLMGIWIVLPLSNGLSGIFSGILIFRESKKQKVLQENEMCKSFKG
ncbi:MAG: MATE family efflux transporter [Sarcina sp.]